MCKNCQLKPVYEFTNKRKLCRICFIKYFQKKVLYTIRRFSMIRQNDVVGYFGTQGCTPKNIQKNIFTRGKDFREVVLEDVLKMVREKSFVKIIKLPAKKKIDKIAVASTIDLEANEIINEIIGGDEKNLKKTSPIYGKLVKPLYLFLDEEVLLYAKLRKLKFKKVKETPQAYPEKSSVKIFTRSKDKIRKFIDELEKKHPEVKRAVVKGILGL